MAKNAPIKQVLERPNLRDHIYEILKKEIIFQADLERLIGKRPFDKPTTYEAYTKNGLLEEKTKKEENDKKEAEAIEKSEEPLDQNEKIEDVQEEEGV